MLNSVRGVLGRLRAGALPWFVSAAGDHCSLPRESL